MLFSGAAQGGYRAVAFAFFVLVCACSRSGAKKTTVAAKPKTAVLCPGGESEDPGLGRLEDGINAFDAKEYTEAEAHFRGLLGEFPRSATLREWLGDTILFDKGRDEVKAALESRPEFEEAFRLHDAGCTLPRRARYYALMGDAYGALRLVKAKGRNPEEELTRAEKILEKANAEFPMSAEIPYTQARVSCARLSQPGATRDFGPCLKQLEQSFSTADSLERPRFLRTHRSTQDWIVRSRSQSEFGELRREPAYTALLERVLRKVE